MMKFQRISLNSIFIVFAFFIFGFFLNSCQNSSNTQIKNPTGSSDSNNPLTPETPFDPSGLFQGNSTCERPDSTIYSDSSFGIQNKLLLQLCKKQYSTISGWFQDMILDSQGRMLVLTGWEGDFQIVRMLPDGSRDPLFGDNGMVQTDIGVNSFDESVTLDIDEGSGKIIVAGYTERNGPWILPQKRCFALAQYNNDGTLDSQFAENGILTGALGLNCSEWDSVKSVQYLPDGKILLFGSFSFNSGTKTTMTVHRYLSQGTLDINFGLQGKLDLKKTTTSEDYPGQLSLLGDGKIMISGLSSVTGGTNYIFLAKLTSQGTFDTTFNSNGKNFLELDSNRWLIDIQMIPQGDGKIILGGTLKSSNQLVPDKTALLRLTDQGQLDTEFNQTGLVVSSSTYENESFKHLIQNSDGKFYSLGSASILSNTKQIGFLSRHLPNGALDTSFGQNGRIEQWVDVDIENLQYKIIFDGVNHFFVGGMLRKENYWNAFFSKYFLDGSTDISYQNQGIHYLGSYHSSDENFKKVTVDSSGNYWVSGSSTKHIAYMGGILKLDSHGNLNNDFGDRGFAQVLLAEFPPENNISFNVNGHFLQNDGKVIVYGQFENKTYEYNAFVARFNSSGSLDVTFNQKGYRTFNIDGNSYLRIKNGFIDTQTGVMTFHGAFVSNYKCYFYHLKLNSDGSLNTSESSTGYNLTLLSNVFSCEINESHVLANGQKVLLMNQRYTDHSLYRILTNGSLDNTFGGTGSVSLDTFGIEYPTSVAINSQGDMFTLGITSGTSPFHMKIVSLTSTGTLNLNFNGTGILALTPSSPLYNATAKIKILGDQSLLVVGSVIQQGHGDIAVVKMSQSGALVSSFHNGGMLVDDIGGTVDSPTDVLILPNSQMMILGKTNRPTHGFSMFMSLYSP